MLAGKPAEAASALERAVELYEQKGVVIAAARAHARIEHLARAH
jgi:hypothetical protein